MTNKICLRRFDPIFKTFVTKPFNADAYLGNYSDFYADFLLFRLKLFLIDSVLVLLSFKLYTT